MPSYLHCIAAGLGQEGENSQSLRSCASAFTGFVGTLAAWPSAESESAATKSTTGMLLPCLSPAQETTYFMKTQDLLTSTVLTFDHELGLQMRTSSYAVASESACHRVDVLFESSSTRRYKAWTSRKSTALFRLYTSQIVLANMFASRNLHAERSRTIPSARGAGMLK